MTRPGAGAARNAARLLLAYARAGVLGSDPEVLGALCDLCAFVGSDEMSEGELRAKCEALAAAGDAAARATLKVLARLDQQTRRARVLLAANQKLRAQVRGHCDRIAAQSEALARVAERQARPAA